MTVTAPLAARVPATGEVVRVRTRRYLVQDVTPPRGPGEQTLVSLSCIDDDAQGDELTVLWESEVDAAILGPESWDAVRERGFDPPRLFSAYYHTLRWSCVTSTDPKLFQAPHRAGIEVLPYQLEPLRKALRLPRVNLFIADDVGLGKTIEAGLIVRELMMRQRVQRIVVAAPPSVVLQWRDELETRFGLTFVVYDRAYVTDRRRERGYSVNPWTTHSRFIISHALLRDETYAAPLRDWLDSAGLGGSLLILDEAHNAAPASGARYAVDSHLTRTIRDLAPRFEHRLFLSATPHNGHSNSFAALLEMLDPQRFCRGVKVRPAHRDAVMVRRLKEDLREIGLEFPKRKVVQVDRDGLPPDAPELELARLLDEYRAAREARLAGATKSAQNAAALVLVSLQKRLLSSIEAFAFSLAAHRRGLDRKRAGAAATTDADRAALVEAPGADDDRGDAPDEEIAAEHAEAMARATAASAAVAGAPSERELALLARMEEIAARARGTDDPRVAWLREFLAKELRPGGAWSDRRLLIFTEYADTQRWLEQRLRAALAEIADPDGERRIALFHGRMGSDRTREEVKAAFNARPSEHPLRILIATDAAREGVNLQNHCADLVHFDVPWNPSRMEQRNGRIDRKLQRAKEVRCYYFVFTQRPQDCVLPILVEKTKIIQRELGSLTPVIERRIGELLARGIASDRAREIARSLEAIEIDRAAREVSEEELEAARERREKLTEQVRTLERLLETSRDYLGFEVGAFRAALSESLELLHAEPLRSRRAPDGAERWTFPALDKRAGADPTWQDALDALRAPRRPEQKLWEWRKESPIRPVIFADPGTLDQDAVHLHLEHRVVQRLLGRFRAQGFVHHDLARACVAQSRDPVRRVLILGRLALYGERASRLHDEVVAVTARWVEPAKRKGPLEPHEERGRERALELLEEALGAAKDDAGGVPEADRAALRAHAPRDLDDLLPLLNGRAAERSAAARAELAKRAIDEAAAMREILQQQRTQIGKQLAEAEKEAKADPQLRLADWAEDERRQVEADRRFWVKRLAEIEREIDSEPERVRRAYDVRAERIEPVGLVYLWPAAGPAAGGGTRG